MVVSFWIDLLLNHGWSSSLLSNGSITIKGEAQLDRKIDRELAYGIKHSNASEVAEKNVPKNEWSEVRPVSSRLVWIHLKIQKNISPTYRLWEFQKHFMSCEFPSWESFNWLGQRHANCFHSGNAHESCPAWCFCQETNHVAVSHSNRE